MATSPDRVPPLLQRLIALCGGEKALCAKLGSGPEVVRGWLSGSAVPDDRAFDEMVALLVVEEGRASAKQARAKLREGASSS